MPFRPAVTFADLAAVLTDPGAPLAAQHVAWSDLKAARGQTVRFDRLSPQHLRGPAPAPAPGGTVAAIDAARARVRDRIRAALSVLPGDGGTAA